MIHESHKRQRVVIESDDKDLNVLNNGFSIFSCHFIPKEAVCEAV